MTKRQRHAGFTLAEALVIVAVIGIVGLIVGVQVNNFVNKANLEGVSGEVRTFLESAKTATVRENAAISVAYQVVGGHPTLQLVTPAGVTLRSLTLPDFVQAAVNPGTVAPGAWPTPTPGSLFTCDSQGRTLATTGRQVTATQVVALTHKGMLDITGYAEVRPRLRYDVELYPLWTVNIRKQPY